ncbi:MAG: hypothetical protein Q9Q40_08670 [Acidobacteriota bacterium]|nr:hypothetical protein [Acidobacteriota bacterium]MDQ7088949.1 hypothetical protein [Acidobacteriota bacterium]
MDRSAQTVAELMEALARQTGASRRFVESIRLVFAQRGVLPHDPAEPYFDAIVDTFRREEALEAQRVRSAAALEKMQRALVTWERCQRELVARLLAIGEGLDARARRLGRGR